MVTALQVAALLLVAVAMALPLAHALELPGKWRLSKEDYLAMQPVYYPGFTLGGLAEPLSLLVLLLLLFVSPRTGAALWLTGGAFVALLAMHGAYWLLTHPVNNFWLKDAALPRAGAGFFAFDPLGRHEAAGQPPWRHLRNRWEFSHVVRAALGLTSLTLLAAAVAA